MEAKIVERLRQLSSLRRQFVLALHARCPPLGYLEINWVFHAVSVTTTIVLIAALYGTTRSLNLFSFHPLCMIIGCGLCLPQGIIAYKNHFLLESLAPIMQHTKRSKVRAIHQTVQFLGVGFLLLGLLFILAQKIEVRHSIVPHSIHSLLAVSVIVAVLIQVVVGQEKLQHHQLMKTNRKIRRWHGDMGLLLWDALCLTLITGLLAFLPFSIASYLVLPFPVVLWLAVIMQMISKNAVKDEELDWGSGEYSAVGDITYDANVTPANAGDEESTVGLLAQQTHHRRSSANLTAHDEYTIQRESSTGGGELTPSSAGELYLQDDDDDF